MTSSAVARRIDTSPRGVLTVTAFIRREFIGHVTHPHPACDACAALVRLGDGRTHFMDPAPPAVEAEAAPTQPNSARRRVIGYCALLSVLAGVLMFWELGADALTGD